MINGLARLLPGAVLVSLVACGGGGGGDGAFSGGSGSSGSSGSATGGDGDVVLRLGSGAGDSFESGQLALGLSSLAAGGQTSVTATVVDSNGAPYTAEPLDVAFSSTCSGQSKATFDSPVSTLDGYAVTTYQAAGCEGSDTITATAVVNGTTLKATANVTIQAATIGSIEFVGASPSTIGLKGTGLTEASTVQFKVVDTNNNPVVGKQVNFALDSAVGGISLSSSSDTSNGQGIVQTTVNSGTVSTTVRVTAQYAQSTSIGTQSDGLVISTGVGDQNSFSISLETFNIEALSYNGETVEVSIFAADHFNNPVPDGVSVYFTTEGGQIDPSCSIQNGSCSVIWTSSDPRPADGRATILATMVGEESFVDLNGDGLFNGSDTFTDLPEAFLDEDEDGVRDGTEEFRDFNSNGVYNTADGKYSGVLCGTHDTIACADSTSVHVRKDIVLVMSGSEADISVSPNPINTTQNATQAITVTVVDLNGQPMPAETSIKLETSNGSISGSSAFVVPSTNRTGANKTQFTAGIEGDDTSSTGLLTITVTTPKGTVTTRDFTVSD